MATPRMATPKFVEPIELTEPIGSSWEMVESPDTAVDISGISDGWMVMNCGDVPFRFTYLNEKFTSVLVGNVVVYRDKLGFVRFDTKFSITSEK